METWICEGSTVRKGFVEIMKQIGKEREVTKGSRVKFVARIDRV